MSSIFIELIVELKPKLVSASLTFKRRVNSFDKDIVIFIVSPLSILLNRDQVEETAYFQDLKWPQICTIFLPGITDLTLSPTCHPCTIIMSCKVDSTIRKCMSSFQVEDPVIQWLDPFLLWLPMTHQCQPQVNCTRHQPCTDLIIVIIQI